VSYVEWLESAISELRRAEERMSSGDHAYACFHAEQAAQFALKALLLRHGAFMRTHDLVLLYSRARAYGLEADVDERDLRELMIHYFASRYPDARRRYQIVYNEHLARRMIDIARRIVEEVRACLKA